MTPAPTVGRAAGAQAVGPFLLRLALVYAALAVTVVLLERPIVSATAPLARLGLALFAPELTVRSLEVEQGRLAASVTVARAEVKGPPRRIGMSVATNARTMLVAPILTLSVLLAWRFRSRAERAVALLAGGLLTTASLMNDLASGVTTGVDATLGESHRFAAFYRFLLDNGGRQLLALAAAAAGIWLAAELARRRVRPAEVRQGKRERRLARRRAQTRREKQAAELASDRSAV